MDVNEEWGMCSHISAFHTFTEFPYSVRKLLISIFILLFVTFGALIIFDQAFVKSISPYKLNLCLLGLKLCKGRIMLVRTRWTADTVFA